VEAIRSIQTVANGEIHLQLPKQFWGTRSRNHCPPVTATGQKNVTTKKSLRGSLKHYAKPDLIAQEQNAWQMMVSEQYENR